MKQKKPVINQQDLPMRFGSSLWIIFYLIFDKFESGPVTWYIFYTLLGIWTLFFGFLKSREQPFSVVSFKNNIDRWLKQ